MRTKAQDLERDTNGDVQCRKQNCTQLRTNPCSSHDLGREITPPSWPQLHSPDVTVLRKVPEYGTVLAPDLVGRCYLLDVIIEIFPEVEHTAQVRAHTSEDRRNRFANLVVTIGENDSGATEAILELLHRPLD